MKKSFFLFLLVCLNLAQCTKDSSEESSSDLTKARALWDSKKIESYSLTFTVTCFCIYELNQPAEVVVKNNKIISVNNEPYNDSFLLYASYLTIEELFTHIETMRKKNPVVEELTFDPTYGFPSNIYYDVSEMIADEEIGYKVSNFKPE